MLFHPETYQNLYLVHNMDKVNDLKFYNNTAKDERYYHQNNLQENNYCNKEELEKINYRNNKDEISDLKSLNNKYDADSHYCKYNRDNINERRPLSSLTENPDNTFINKKEGGKFGVLDDSVNRFSNPPRVNYLKDSKEDDLQMNTINTKKDYGTSDQLEQPEIPNYKHQENSIRENYDNYRLNNRERKEFIDANHNNDIGNTREKFNCNNFI